MLALKDSELIIGDNDVLYITQKSQKTIKFRLLVDEKYMYFVCLSQFLVP